MLPATLPLDAYRPFRRDLEAQRPAIEAIAARHGLPAGELAPFPHGTQIVWGTRHSVIKLFVPTWPEDTQVEMRMLERLAGTGLPVPQLEANGEVAGWPYVVMSRLPGRSVAEEWPGLDADGRERLAHDIGAAMARLAALPVTGLEHHRRRSAGASARRWCSTTRAASLTTRFARSAWQSGPLSATPRAEAQAAHASPGTLRAVEVATPAPLQ